MGLTDLLAEALGAARAAEAGAVASYIPELADQNPDLLAIAVCGVDGRVDVAGDAAFEFTLQSLSKPFAYAAALEELGAEAVHARVGVEPSGDAFDSVIRLEQATSRPHNPMINAGAIAVTGLSCTGERGNRVARLLSRLSAWAGRDLPGIDAPVFLSERATGHRNRAIAHLMRHVGVLEAPVDEVLELYFQQCASIASCRDVAVMAATLAAGGRNPVTNRDVVSRNTTRSVLSVLSTCGLYDASGRFAFEVGLPAKTGVSGGVLVVVPGRFGLAAFAPGLDPHGNSVRGVAAVRHVCERLELHPLGPRGARADSPRSEPARLAAACEAARSDSADSTGGRVADYIPQLARESPDRFALAICTTDGDEVLVGDGERRFSLQAAANPFAYACLSEQLGRDAIHSRVGVEPSGNPYNAIFLDTGGRPFNPLGNAGAICVASLVPGGGSAERLQAILGGFGALAGEAPPRVDLDVFEAERQAGHRNRAIASLLRSFGVVEDEEAAVELYLQQCSVRVSCATVARMAATLAGFGVQPRTRRPVLGQAAVRDTLSLMYTCGMHDESGRFAFEVGVPAKSGISGVIAAVVPGRAGLAVWSPAVDRSGTSVRGLAALSALIDRLDWRVFSVRPSGRD